MTTKFSSNSFISLVSYKNLNRIGRYIATIAAVLFLAIPQEMWAITYNATLTGSAGTGGSILLATSNSKPSSYDGTKLSKTASSSGGGCVFYAWAIPNVGYYWSSWSTTNGKGTITLATPNTNTAQSITCTAGQTNNADESSGKNYYVYDTRVRTNNYTITANFAKITLTAPSDVTFTPTNAQTSCGDYTGTLTFTASHSCAKADFNDPVVTKNSGNGILTVTSWEVDGTQVKVNYKFTGNNTYGGDDHNRANSFTVTLTTKADESASCNVTADFPNVAISDGNAETVYPLTPSVDVAGSAVFPVTYSDGAGDFTASISGATGGTWTLGTISFASTNAATGAGNITVPFTFNAGGATGDFSATLTLTATNAGGATKTITLTASAEPEAENDVRVTEANGDLVDECDWATAISTYQAAGRTFTILRNIDLGELSASQEIKNNITLDLNGKTLSASLKASNTATYQRMFLLNTAGKTFTIADSKTGGTIDVTANYANVKYAIYVAKGNVVLNSGKVQIKNTTTGNSNVTYATGVYVAAGTTFTMNGGEIFVSHPSYRRADGVLGAGSPTVPSTITINGGKITAESGTYAYGVRSTGIVNVHNVAEINANTLTGAYAYGLYMGAYSNATAASCYSSTLTMTGGTINATTMTSTAYGIYAEALQTASASATDGTLTNKSAAVLNITGGTINSTTTTTTAYGIYVMGRYNSLTNTYSTSQIKNATVNAIGKRGTAYGVYSAASTAAANGGLLLGDVELTDVTVNAITESVTADGKTTNYNTAYCLYVQATQVTGTGADNTGVEYAAGAKMTVNSGTYTATTTGTNAFSAVTGQRSITFNEGAEGFPELIIHGGKFVANAGTSGARAVSTGGYTTIDGGEFEANAGTSTAYGLYAITGKLTANGVKVTATAQTSTAYGAYLEASVTNYDGIKAGVLNHGEMVLNNLDVTATTVTGNDARGVSVYTASRTLTQATFDGLSDANKTKYDKTYVMQDGVTRGGQWACAGKLTVNGGTYNVTSAGITAYGACLNTTIVTANMTNASGAMTLKNATFNVQTNNANAVSDNKTNTYGVNAGGKTTIDGCTFNITGAHTNTYGVLATDKKTTISNSKITTSGKVSVYGIYGTVGINATNGYTTYADIELNEGNNITATATAGNSAYALYLSATKKAIASGDFAGDYAIAATAIVNGGKYTATASGTTAYAAGVADPVLQGEATATPTLIVNDGKFYGSAGTTPFADVSLAGEPEYFVLNGGYYVKDENLDKKLGEGMNKVAVKSGTPEYTEGYRWRVTDNMTGEYVCKIKENGTSYASLEEALQVVNAAPNSTWTIIMIANYTLSKGDYVLPANTTLLIPYKSNQTTINGTTPAWIDEGNETPRPYCKLTFASGVNMTVSGKIEASSTTYIVSSALTGIVGGAYGWLQLNEGAHIDLESGAYMFAWGYVTGEGTINAKTGSFIYEDFQLGDWRGGSVAFTAQGNKNGINNKGVFLVTHYFFQNVECEVTYHPGSQSIAYTGTYLTYDGTKYLAKSKPITMVGTSGAMFLMNTATAGADTWVKKKYNTNTDRLEWTMNSGAELGSISMNLTFANLPYLVTLYLGGSTVNINSADYVLPITSNFTITANYGEIKLSNDVCFIPGSEVIINKEAVLTVPSGYNVFIYDSDDWSQYGRYYYLVGYSPSWKVSPRNGDKNTKLPDAKFEVAGLLKISGALYTTSSGANICSTRENAGKVLFNVAPASSLTNSSTTTSNTGLQNYFCQITASSGGMSDCKVTYTAKPINSAWLKNEDGTYSKPTSSNTSAGDTWVYMQSLTSDTYEWTKASEDGCFTIRSTGDTKTYVHPSDWVAVGSVNANHAYPSEDATRMFVNTEAASTSASCKWWDVNPTPEVIDGTTYYVANNENFDNFGTYYYWDNTTSYWKPKKITVTWQNEDGTKITNGTYGDLYDFNTSPKFQGENPKKTSTAIEKYDWIGWRDAEGNIYDKNATLPRATSNVTYTAYFNATKYQYTITFKNDDNSDLWAGLVDAGTTGAELQALFETKYNEKTGSTIPLKASSVDKVYTFSSWNTSLATVTAAATYTANYTWVTRQYTVTFLNYNAVDELYTVDVDYNTRPTYSGVTPFRANTSAYSYNWTGWQQGTNTYGTTAALPVVTGNISYIATFAQTELKYQVFFKRQDGSIIDAPFFSYEETPAAFPANPTMASTVSTDYTFREWSPATLVPVTEDGMVYTALFDESPRQYTAHFVNYNGTSLNADQTIDYNTVPAYTGVTPMKPNDSRNSYEFSGWAWTAGEGWEAGSVGLGETLPAIKGEMTFTAQYTPTLLQFDVIYQREDGFVILRDKKKWGESSAFPTTYTGATSGLNYEDATYSYTFDHWNPATVVTPVIKDATYTAYYNRSIKTYSFSSIAATPEGYGTVSQASLASIPGGSAVTVNGNKITVNGTTITATPAEADAQYTYTFSHWNNVPATVTGNVDNIEAFFTRTVNSYTVTWKNADGTVLETDENVEYGTTPTYDGETPTKDADASYVYTFNTWTPAVGAVTGDATYTATYSTEPTVASVTVSGNTTYYASVADAITFANGKTDAVVTILQDDAVESEISISAAMTIDLNGKTVSSTQATASTGVFKISASGKTVTINGAGGTINHTANASVFGIYVAAGSTLNMTGGTVIVDGGSGNPRGIYVRGASGSTATVSLTDVEVETKSTGNNSIAVYTYAYANVTIHSGTYTATATSSSARYAAYTRNASGSKITIEGGKFNGQDKDVYKGGTTATISISGGYYVHDTNIETYCATNYAVFDLAGQSPYKYEVAEAYMITFKNGDDVLQSTAVKKGTMPVYSGEEPTKATDAQYTYTFTGWSPAITAVSAAATYTATFSRTPRTYTVTLHTNDGSINAGDVTEYTYGTGATLPTNVTKDGHEFGGWFDNDGLTGDAVTTISTTATGNKEYWAKWTASIVDRELDIVDWTSNSITINVTNLKAVGGTNKNNWKICVNGTDYTRTSPECSAQSRTLTIPGLTLKPNENLLIQLKNDADVIESQHNYKIPQIYTENATLSGTNEESVVYVYGGKLTISGNTTLAALYVCPGAEVEVTDGNTLTVGKLVLRTKPWATAAISGSVKATKNYYTRIAPDGSDSYPTGKYYQFGLPYECAISAVRLSDGTTPAYNTTWILKSYNEEKRATNGATGENWDALAADATIEAGRGYEMFSTYKYYREYYFPVIPTDNTSVAVTRHGTDKNNSGWNIVCSPLMSIYQNDSDPVTGLKVSWLLADGSYDQAWPETIWPALPFSYQASATGYLDFSTNALNQAVSAPRRAAYKDNIQTEWLHLDVKNANGVGDHTSIFAHPDRFDATYETGIDVAKQSFTASRALIYSSHVYGEMAFAGLPDSLLEHGVALTVYSPINQELTISMRENNWLNRMAYVLLIDKETGAQVDLMNGNYTFEALEGTMRGRFFIQCVFNAEAPEISTGVNHLDTENDKAQKIMYNDKVYIIYQGRVYDMTGRQCELR